MNYSAEIARLYADPNRDETEFWSLVIHYIRRCANRHVQNHQIEELTSDVIEQVMLGLPRFKPLKGASSFTRWISQIVARRGANMRRDVYLLKEASATSLTTERDDGQIVERDPAEFLPVITRAEFESVFYQEQPSPAVTRWLNGFAQKLRGSSRVVFDFMRSGLKKAEAAEAAGISQERVRQIFNAWRKAAQRQSFPLPA